MFWMPGHFYWMLLIFFYNSSGQVMTGPEEDVEEVQGEGEEPPEVGKIKPKKKKSNSTTPMTYMTPKDARYD